MELALLSLQRLGKGFLEPHIKKNNLSIILKGIFL